MERVIAFRLSADPADFEVETLACLDGLPVRGPGADVGQGVKANEAYDGRGMMTEAPIVGDFIVRFFLNMTKVQHPTGSWCKIVMLSRFARCPSR